MFVSITLIDCAIQVQVLGLLAEMMDSTSHKAFLIVVESLADVRHWAGQIAHFVPELHVVEYHGSKGDRAEALRLVASGGLITLQSR